MANKNDERLVYQGPIQRLLMSPEIGGVVGLVGVWLSFWALSASDVFGTAAGTATYLDAAAPTGIMAVAVAMLMIGGEFDLSSGAMTGATGGLVILLAKEVGEFGGAGLHLHLAVPLTLLFALGIGYFNGTMIERTSLPSFIVTLGTFFMLIGAKLGFFKLFTDKVIVEGIDNATGYDFYHPIFASSWERNSHIWEGRDIAAIALAIVGFATITIGFLDRAYTARNKKNIGGAVVCATGAAVAIGSIITSHFTDGTAADMACLTGVSIGVFMFITGYAVFAFEPVHSRMGQDEITVDSGGTDVPGAGGGGDGVGSATATSLGNTSGSARRSGFTLAFLGVIASAIGVVAAVTLEAGSQTIIGFLLTEEGLRGIAFVGLGFGGVIAVLAAANRMTRGAAHMWRIIAAIMLIALAFFIRSQSTSVKFRAELLSVLVVIASIIIALSTLATLFQVRTVGDVAIETRGRRLSGFGALACGAAVVIKLLFMTSAEAEVARGTTVFRVSILWFILVTLAGTWVLRNTRFGNWIFAVGGNTEAARSVGVPAARTKTILFMTVSAAAWLVGMLRAFRFNSIQADVGDGQEFFYIIAAVVGGNLLTGGYGSAIGGAIGAVIIAMSRQGIINAGFNSNWVFLFLGAILLVSVIVNNEVRTRAGSGRKRS